MASENSSKNPVLRNILAVVVGFIGGSMINLGLVQVGHTVYPVDPEIVNDLDKFAEFMATAGNEHFIFPLIAHAAGTFAGAFFAALIAANRKMVFALVIGLLYLAGGIYANITIPAPSWFTVTDLMVAYIPMAWLGGKFGIRLSKN